MDESFGIGMKIWGVNKFNVKSFFMKNIIVNKDKFVIFVNVGIIFSVYFIR